MRCLLTPGIALLLAAGCRVPTTAFRIVDHRGPGATMTYREHFSGAYYRFDSAGDVDIVVRRHVEGSPDTPPVTQVIHLHGLWRSIPGRTVAHRTQINATVTYQIESGPSLAVFEGAGSLFLDQRKKDGLLLGELELATLDPAHRTASAADLFNRAELAGQFAAKPNPRRAVALINQLRQRSARLATIAAER